MELYQNPGQGRCLGKNCFSLHTLPPNQGTRRILTVIRATKIWLIHINKFRCPRRAAREDLGKSVRTWISNRENIIIYIDANDRIIKGP